MWQLFIFKWWLVVVPTDIGTISVNYESKIKIVGSIKPFNTLS